MDSSTTFIPYPEQEKPRTFRENLEDELQYHKDCVNDLTERLTTWNNLPKEVQDLFLKLLGYPTNQPPDEPCDTSVS